MQLAFEKTGGIMPAIIQDDKTGDILMLGFMNEQALAETQRTREVVFFSRSRNRLWKKGESSGHVLKVRDIRIDCDADSLLIRVDPVVAPASVTKATEAAFSAPEPQMAPP